MQPKPYLCRYPAIDTEGPRDEPVGEVDYTREPDEKPLTVGESQSIVRAFAVGAPGFDGRYTPAAFIRNARDSRAEAAKQIQALTFRSRTALRNYYLSSGRGEREAGYVLSAIASALPYVPPVQAEPIASDDDFNPFD